MMGLRGEICFAGDECAGEGGGERMDPMLDGNEHLAEIVRNIQLDGNDGRVICFAGNKCAREGGK